MVGYLFVPHLQSLPFLVFFSIPFQGMMHLDKESITCIRGIRYNINIDSNQFLTSLCLKTATVLIQSNTARVDLIYRNSKHFIVGRFL